MSAVAKDRVDMLYSVLQMAAEEGRVPMLTIPGDEEEGYDEEVLTATDARSWKRYLNVLIVFEMVLELVYEKRTMSLRDVYYSSVHLKSQIESNAAVRDVGNLLSLSRRAMGIIPVARGFVAGGMRFRTRQSAEGEWSTWTNCQVPVPSGGQGVLISSLWNSAVEVDTEVTARTLLVVEKEGIFHRLCEDALWDRVDGGVVMVTGCGMPDVATRALVRCITDRNPHLLAVGLVDFNPYGVGILCSYRFAPSTARLMHEGRDLDVPRLKWLGLRGAQMQLELQECPTLAPQLTPLSVHDERRLQGLLANPQLEPAYKQSLLAMRQWGKKCELEVLFGRGLHYVAAMVERALIAADYI
jgi:meiotic recombination protein SPO11